MTPLIRARFRLAKVAVTALVVAMCTAHAAEFQPTKTVTIVVPFAPGGPNDAVARILSTELAKSWKHPVIVENRPGAGGLVGVSSVAKSDPDGHTLVVATNVLTFPILAKDVALKPREDVVPITSLAGGPLLLATSTTSKLKSAGDVARHAASHPGQLSVATIALTLAQLDAAYMFQGVMKADVLLVPFNSAAQALQALAGGQVDTYLTVVTSAKPLIDGGRLAGLGLAADKRDPRLPAVPTLKEQGIPFEAGFWIGLYGPKGMPADLARKIAADVAAVAQVPEVREGIDKAGMSVMLSNPAAMRQQMETEERRYKEAALLLKPN